MPDFLPDLRHSGSSEVATRTSPTGRTATSATPVATWHCTECDLTGTGATEAEAAYLAEVHDATQHHGAPTAATSVVMVTTVSSATDLGSRAEPTSDDDLAVEDSLALSGGKEDGPLARRFVRAVARRHGTAEDSADRAVQLTGELLAHQARLRRTPTVLTCTVTADELRVAIEVDCGTGDAPGLPSAESRNRLVLVDALADRWGVDSEGPHSTWWFVVR